MVAQSGSRRRKKRVAKATVRPEFAREAMRELKAYRKTGKAANWADVKRKLGLPGNDPVVERVRAARQRILGGDPHRLFEWAKTIEATRCNRVVGYKPRKRDLP
jgi:hypothetical protein